MDGICLLYTSHGTFYDVFSGNAGVCAEDHTRESDWKGDCVDYDNLQQRAADRTGPPLFIAS